MESPISSHIIKRPRSDAKSRLAQPYLQLINGSLSPAKIKHSSSFKTLKTPATYQSNIPILKDFPMDPAESSYQSPVSAKVHLANESSSRNLSSSKKRIVGERSASSYKPSLDKTTSLLFPAKNKKLRPDSSLSSILSLAKEEDWNKAKPITSPQNQEYKEKNEAINNQFDSAFTKKEDHYQKKFRKSKTAQMLRSSLDSTINQSNLINSFKISSFFTPKANGSSNVTKIVSPNSQSMINCSMNESSTALLASAFEQEKTPKSTFQAYGRKGSDLADYFKVSSKRESLAQISVKPHTANNSVSFKRPLTAQKPSKIKNGVYRIGAHNPTDNERDRLNNFIETNFHEDLTYTTSYMKIPEKKEEEPQVQTLEEAKKYIVEKKQEGNKLFQSIQEFRNSQDVLLNNQSPSNRRKIQEVNIMQDDATPMGMPRLKDFELFNSESGLFRNVIDYKALKNQSASTKNLGKPRERGANFVISESKISYSQIATPKSIIVKEKNEGNEITQRSTRTQLPSKFSEMQKQRFKRLRKSLKFLLKRLARLNISLKEVI